MSTTGFDNDKYLAEQSKCILDRLQMFGNKLYLEFGGKLVFDYHAARILPGFDPNVKVRLLQQLKDKLEIIICLHAGDIERKKIRADFGITYDADTLKLIDDLRKWDLCVSAVVITRYEHQPVVKQFIDLLNKRDIKVYTHRAINGYPANVDLVVSEDGYGINEYIKTTKPIVVVNAPGPGSGKLATCLSQLYHEHQNGVAAGYAKFETFPIWNIPLKHPVNIAYESATADLGDYNEIDPFHLEEYGKTSINYNRDIEVFPVVRRILEKILGGKKIYKSPTDMGVNRAGFAIVNDVAVREAATQEVIRRYLRYNCEHAIGLATAETVERAELLMRELNVGPEDRTVVIPARKEASRTKADGKGNEGIYCGAALQLKNGTIVTGHNSSLMHAASSLVLNAVKALAGIPENVHLISPTVMKSIGQLKSQVLNTGKLNLDMEETLMALSVSAPSNPSAELGMQKLRDLKGCEMHITHMPTPGDEAGLRKIGVNLTSDANFSSKSLYLV